MGAEESPGLNAAEFSNASKVVRALISVHSFPPFVA